MAPPYRLLGRATLRDPRLRAFNVRDPRLRAFKER